MPGKVVLFVVRKCFMDGRYGRACGVSTSQTCCESTYHLPPTSTFQGKFEAAEGTFGHGKGVRPWKRTCNEPLVFGARMDCTL